MIRSMRAAPVFAALTCAMLVLATVFGAQAAGTTAPAHATAMVTIQNFAFSPATLTVAPGTTVVWTNRDSTAHTVTSDTGAWPASGPLATGQSFSLTFARPGTYPYHCSIHPTMKASVVVSAGAMSGGSMGGRMSTMGPMRRALLPAFIGWYDNHRVLFLATDTSSQAEAMSEHINFSAGLAKSLSSAETIYMVTNGAFANRGAVFSSEPGESDYTPLWQEVMVTWSDPSQAVALGSDDQIKGLAAAGKVTLQMTGTVLNCPIIKVAAHGASS
jgi:plastocyanin